MALTLILALSSLQGAQKSPPPEGTQPLVLTGSIPLPNVQGRIDHLASDSKGRLFVSALGNNTEEVLDLSAGRRVHSISGVPRPQGVVYVPELNKLFVGSDEGKLHIYDAAALELITSIDFGDDVDNLRYDSTRKLVYVAYGDADGAIGMVDASTNKRLEEEFKLGAHPESFQLEKSGPNLYVNLPELKQIAAINRKTRAITRWPVSLESNFPMALDEASHRVFIVTREPARMAVFDTREAWLRCAPLCSELRRPLL